MTSLSSKIEVFIGKQHTLPIMAVNSQKFYVTSLERRVPNIHTMKSSYFTTKMQSRVLNSCCADTTSIEQPLFPAQHRRESVFGGKESRTTGRR